MIANLLPWSAQVMVLVCAAAVALKLLRLRHPRAELLLLQSTLAASLLLPVLQPWVRPQLAPPAIQRSPDIAPIALAITTEPVSSTPFDDTTVILVLLAAGAMMRILWLAFGMFRLDRYRRSARPIAPHFEAEDLTGARAEFAVTAEVSSPVTFGWLRPFVLVPPAFLEMPPLQQQAIACHELLHVRRRDWLACLFEELTASVLWFHPAVWYLLRRIRQLREQVVDAEVVALTQGREHYIDALLTIAVTRPLVGLSAAPLFLRKQDLACRVRALLHDNRISTWRVMTSTAGVAAAAFTAAIWATSLFPLIGAPQQQPGVISRVDIRSLPAPLMSTVESRLSALPGQAFTTGLMAQVNGDLQAIDKGIMPQWIEETPGLYSLSISYKTGKPAAPSKLAFIDSSRLPDALRTRTEQAVQPFLHQPFTDSMVDSVRSALAAIDPGIAFRWSADTEGSMGLILMHNLPPGGWQPVFGLLARIDLSQLPETDRAQLERTLAPYVKAPMTNRSMAEIVRQIQSGGPRWALLWRTEPSATDVTLTVLPPPHLASMSTPPPPPPAPPPAREQKTVAIGPAVLASQRLRHIDPIYPPMAQQVRLQGTVRLAVQIGTDGRVQSMTLVSGHPLLVQSAMEAVRQWEYRPVLINGEPCVASSYVDIAFAPER